eukprot:224708_1
MSIPLSLPNVILASIFAFIFLFIYTPIAMYQTMQFYDQRHHLILVKRYGNITLYESYFLIIKLFIISGTQFLLIGWSPFSLHFIIGDCIVSSFGYLIFWFWVYRFWMNHFNICFQRAIINDQWKKCLNPLLSSTHLKKNNWYYIHRLTFGNKKYMLKYLIIPFIIISILLDCTPRIYEWTIYNSNPNIYRIEYGLINFFRSIIYCTPYICLLIIFRKTPRIKDNLLISDELLRIF